MMPTRWSHLARHGLLGTSLVAAAASTGRAEPCNTSDEAVVAVVVGLDFAPRTRLIGGVEVRKCLSRTTDGFVRIEAGGGPARLIGGARVRPFETVMDTRDREMFGLEAGAAWDTEARLGAHLGVSYGVQAAYVAAQALFRIAGPAQQRPRMSGIIGLAPWELKREIGPVTVDGRPLFVDGHMLRPEFAAPLAALRDREDRAVRDHFASSARFEYSSVWTFLRLAAELHGVGAPAHLIARALDAADDEVRHAHLCAEAAGGISLAPLPMTAAQPRFTHRTPRALAILAAEAWREGCLNEGAAAEEARLASAETSGATRAMLATIATDEARHAELAWATLAWLFEVAPDAARAALETPSTPASIEVIDPALAARGVPTAPLKAAALAHANTRASARLADFV